MGSISAWGLPRHQPHSTTAHQTRRWDNAQGRSQGINLPSKYLCCYLATRLFLDLSCFSSGGVISSRHQHAPPTLGRHSGVAPARGSPVPPRAALSPAGLSVTLSCPPSPGEPSITATQAADAVYKATAGGAGSAAQQPPVLSGVTSGAAPQRVNRCGEPAWGTQCHPKGTKDKTPRPALLSPHPCSNPPPPARAHRCAQVWVRNKSCRKAVSRFSPCEIQRDRVTLPGQPMGKRHPRCLSCLHHMGTQTHIEQVQRISCPLPRKLKREEGSDAPLSPEDRAENPQTHRTEEPPAQPRSLACVYFLVDCGRL